MRAFVLIRRILFGHFVISCCIKLMVQAYNKVCHLDRSRRFSSVYSYVTGRTRDRLLYAKTHPRSAVI